MMQIIVQNCLTYLYFMQMYHIVQFVKQKQSACYNFTTSRIFPPTQKKQ